MKKFLKSLMIVLMTLGIMLSALNFISTENRAAYKPDPSAGGEGARGTLQPDGCYGEPLNCNA